MHIPRLVISALRGGSGKTLLSLGLTRAIVRRGHPVKPYKKGPDYIDAAWLTRAAHTPCTNLDPFFLEKNQLLSLVGHTWPPRTLATLPGRTGQEVRFPSVAIIEGNRGLFDGQDIRGTCSTAELARILDAPVILSLDITKMTRTAAAVVAGMANFEKNVHILGVVLNQVGSPRHQQIVQSAIEHYTDIPVLGALPRLKSNPLPERHMGLVSTQMLEADRTLDHLATFIEENTDVDRIIHTASTASPLAVDLPFWSEAAAPRLSSPPRIGYVQDSAFWFYYHENLEALQREGAELVPLSLLDSRPWPENLHGLYLGGGFPEDYAEPISRSPHLARIRQYSEAHMPIYAECGGFMLLAGSIVRDDQHYAMSNIFPVHTHFLRRPQGLGYVTVAVTRTNPFHPVGTVLRGHEFHYSRCVPETEIQDLLTLRMTRGTGMGGRQDGLCLRKTFAAYTHIFAPACPWWAKNFLSEASAFAQKS